MKSFYVKPQVKVVITELQSMFASSPGSDSVIIKPGESNSSDSDARGHRGSWGNLWD